MALSSSPGRNPRLVVPLTAGPAGGSAAVYLDVEQGIALQPDLSWWVAGQCVFVDDCKYKHTTGSTPNPDVYQMLAYLTALQLDEGLLVYAAGEEVPHDMTIRHAGKRIHVRTVGGARVPADILIQIGQLAAEIRAIATQPTSGASLVQGIAS
jgi:5-methylcytosine-specific restriction enzyme subunit McrC